MSSIYIQEPPTEGKVLLITTAGDVDIELWYKEAPKACRNFVQLCMEGYYDGTIFHRVIPKFIVQGGDSTGTGNGGESIYGHPFKDEFHSRLRFVRRGLVAMANAGPNDNGSQFFFTLGPCPELQNKHTIFGKIAGDTIYNLPRFEEGVIDKDDRPEFPHKILSTQVLNNPFTDIVPRILLKIENEISKEKKKGTKNFKLLSFGDEAEEDEEELVTAKLKMPNKNNSAHDIAMDPTLSSSVDERKESENMLTRIREKIRTEVNIKKVQNIDEEISATKVEDLKVDKSKTRSELRAEIRKLKKELQNNPKKGFRSKSPDENITKRPKYESPVVEEYFKERTKYEEEKKKIPNKNDTRESHTLELLQRFVKKIQNTNENVVDDNNDEDVDDEKVSNIETEDDESWLTHRLNFNEDEPVLAKDASTRDDSWYDITDPRNALNKRRREKPKPL